MNQTDPSSGSAANRAQERLASVRRQVPGPVLADMEAEVGPLEAVHNDPLYGTRRIRCRFGYCEWVLIRPRAGGRWILENDQGRLQHGRG